MPDWFSNLETEDVNFIKRFVMSSGSLKEMAREYGVTYPTVRLKLDKLIAKIAASDIAMNEPFIALIRQLTMNEKIDIDTAKLIVNEYRKNREAE